MNKSITCIAVLLSFLVTYSVSAQVRVTKQSTEKISVDISAFQVERHSAAQEFYQVLSSDLNRSGWLIPVRGQGAYRVTGGCLVRGGALRAEVRVAPYGVERSVLGKVYRAEKGDERTLAHQVADEIVKAITGRDGIASTRIVMVGTRSGKKELYLCDADGGRLVQLTRDNSVSVAPSWGPDGNTIYYTSYIKGFPDLYEIDLRTGDRKRICHYSGLNTGGAVSPDGQNMAVILSKDGNPELYIQHMRSGRLTRLTQTPRAVEASPSWSPDGREIVYVSDQSGRPHLYVVSSRGGRPRRITSRGSENVSPDWGGNGLIAYSSRLGGQYVISVLDLSSGQTKTVSSGWGDFEDPSWAPDGRHLVCTRTQNYQSRLYILDTLGESPIELSVQRGDWYSPAWSSGSTGGR